MRNYQFVTWFPKWCGVGFERLDATQNSMGLIYRWWLALGWWEIRRWANPPARDAQDGEGVPK